MGKRLVTGEGCGQLVKSREEEEGGQVGRKGFEGRKGAKRSWNAY